MTAEEQVKFKKANRGWGFLWFVSIIGAGVYISHHSYGLATSLILLNLFVVVATAANKICEAIVSLRD